LLSKSSDINQIVNKYSKIGHRVLMLAYKKVSVDSITLEREELETDFTPLAIALFENPLKEGSKDSIS